MGIAEIGLGVGALGGFLSGAKGTPDQKQITSRGPASPEELQLQQQGMQQYLKQLGLLGGVDDNVQDLDPLRQAALGQQMGVLTGQAFAPNQQELSQIENMRQQQINAGTGDIQRFLDQNQGQIASSAGMRGLRGQALAQLQGQALDTAGQQFGNLVNQAGMQATQSQMQAPYQRVAAQAGAAQQGMTYQDQLRQQAINNRQMASNPALLSYYGNMRDTITTQPGQKGSFLGGVQGALMGGMTGYGQGVGIDAQSGLGDYYRNFGNQSFVDQVESSQGLQTSNASQSLQSIDPSRMRA